MEFLLERIKATCKEKGISLYKLEKEIGLSKGASYKWKNSSPNQDTINKIANYLDVSIDYLVTGNDANQEAWELGTIAGEVYRDKDLQELIKDYQRLSNDNKKLVRNLINNLKDK